MNQPLNYSRARINSQDTGFGQTLLYFFLKIFGRLGIKIINYPVVSYFLLSKKTVRNNSLMYWKSIRPGKSIFWYYRQIYKNYAVFGSTIIDRLLNDFEILNESADNAILGQNLNQGTIIICSHVGGYSFFRYNIKNKKIHILMLQGDISNEANEQESSNHDKKFSLFDKNSQNKAEFISPADPNAIFKAAEVLNQQGILAIMGDRVLNDNDRHNIEVDFFGVKRPFPLGPFYLARATNSSIISVFIIKKGKNYVLEFNDKIEVDAHKKKKEAVEEAFNKYLEDLKKIVNKYPHQWFNFTG